MLIRLAALWLWLLVPGSITVALGGPAGLLPHAVFHPLYMSTLVVVIAMALRLRAATAHRGVRVLSVLVGVSAIIAIVGQAGEEIVVFRHGGLDAPDALMHEADHLSWAIAGEGGIFLGQFHTVAIGVIVGIALLRRHDRRGWFALAPSALYLIDVAGSIAGLLWSGMFLTTVLGVAVLMAVGVRTRRVPTGLDRTRVLLAGSSAVILTP